MTAADFRRLALSLSGAEEGSHMGAVDFRVGGHIFATLAAIKQGYGNLMLTPEIQADFVRELPEVFRTPVILYYFEDFSYRDIADQMELPIGTVMSRLARGKAYLRARLLQPTGPAVAADGPRRANDGL